MFGENPPSDAEIVREILGGNRHAFEVLLERHARMAYAVAFARLGRHEDAQDAVQEAALQAFQRLDRLRDPGHFKAWFATIVRNISINTAKRRWRERPLDEAREESVYDMRGQMEAADLRRALWLQIANLVPDQREVLTLHYHAGMSTQEIAGALGESREAVKKRLQRSRAALSGTTLQTLLEPAEQDEEKRRKRVMALILVAPVSWEQAGRLAPTKEGLPEAVTKSSLLAASRSKPWWLLVAASTAVLVAAISYFVFTRATSEAPARPLDSPAYRDRALPLGDPNPGYQAPTKGPAEAVPDAPPPATPDRRPASPNGKSVKGGR